MSKRAKATHRGECQVCSRVQLLPAGVLAKHGYEVRHGFFSGTCFGSGAKPYEQACDLIEKSKAWARAGRDDLQKQIDEIDSGAMVESFSHMYRPDLSSRGRTVYLWQRGAFVGEPGAVRFCWHDWRGEMHLERQHAGYVAAEKLATEGRRLRREFLVREMKEIDQYIARQQRRLDAWVLKPLTPIDNPPLVGAA